MPVGSFRMFQRALQRKRAAGESSRQTGLGVKTIGVHAVVSCAQAVLKLSLLSQFRSPVEPNCPIF